MQQLQCKTIEEASEFFASRELYSRDFTESLDKPINFSDLSVKEILPKSQYADIPALILKDRLTDQELEFVHPLAFQQLRRIIHMKPVDIDPKNDMSLELFQDYFNYRLAHSQSETQLFRMITKDTPFFKSLFPKVKADNRLFVRAVCSKTYGIFNHDTMLNLIAPIVNSMGYQSMEIHYDLTEMSFRFLTDIEIQANAKVNDPLRIGLSGGNGEGGDRSVYFGNYSERLVCHNGLVKAFDDQRYQHKGFGVEARAKEGLIFAQRELVNYPAQIRQTVRAIVLTPLTALDKLFKGLCKKLGFDEQTATELRMCYDFDQAPTHFSLWRVINAFTLLANRTTDINEKLLLQTSAGTLLKQPEKYLDLKDINDLRPSDFAKIGIQSISELNVGIPTPEEMEREANKIFTRLHIDRKAYELNQHVENVSRKLIKD